MDKNYDFKFKILILGDASSGKTCLLRKYVENIFEKETYITIGLDFKIKLLIFDNYKIKLQMWDTAGHESFRTITKTYYKGADGFIFNLNITDKNSFNNMNYFINLTKKEENNDFVSIICANFCDLKKERKFTEEEIKNYEKIYNMKIFETSAKTGLNIKRAFNYLTILILQRKASKQVLSSFKNWMNNQIYNFEISIFKESNCRNIFKNEYNYSINEKDTVLNINSNSNINADGLIFYIDKKYKSSFEYIINIINSIDNYYFIFKRYIMMIIDYQDNKDKDKKKEDEIINKELDKLCNEKGINIFRIFNKNDIDDFIEKLAQKISFGEEESKVNIKLNKYINF